MFDYDCDMMIEFKEPAFVDCTAVGVCNMTTHGFLGKVHPECGSTANIGSCVGTTALDCKAQIEQPNVVVLCR